MPNRLVVALSAVSITAGILTIVTVVLRRRRNQSRPSLKSSNGGRDSTLYVPVTDIHQYDVHVITAAPLQESQDAIQDLVKATEQLKVIGLDCEWITKDNQRQPVALLQMSSPLCRVCLLFRLNHLVGKLPECIQQILEDRNILKVGVGVMDDANRLDKDYRIVTRGCLDLRQMALRHLSRSIRGRSLGLRELASIVLNHEMEKNDEIRRGDWEADPLSQYQIDYAAEDAIIGSAIFLRIVTTKLRVNRFEGFLGNETWQNITSMCQGLIDVNHSTPNTSARTSKQRKYPQNGVKKTQPLSKAYKPRQTIMYHNCRLLAPDGTLLCTCDRSKALWYIQREIGEMVSEEPLVVRLLFEPAGVPGPDREYYLTEKENKCVVCGWKDSYFRKNIVPHEYRRHFPDYLKKHSSHDVLLLCHRCHQTSCEFDSQLRQDLAEKYDARISNETNAKRVEDPVRVRVRSCAKALLRSAKTGNIPEVRIAELSSIIRNYFSVVNIDEELLRDAVAMDTKVSNEKFAGSHGMKVVTGASQEEGGLYEFERMWRRHFVERMEPRCLPPLWSVDHRHEATVCMK